MDSDEEDYKGGRTTLWPAGPGKFTPCLLFPDSVTPDMATPGLVTPDMATPGLVTPDKFTPGLLFPDYDSMTTSLNEWSRANFSPLVKTSSGGVRPEIGWTRPFHTFRCPHKKANRSSSSLGIRRKRANVIEYVDCPFLIDTKVNPDGSCVVTRASTEHPLDSH